MLPAHTPARAQQCSMWHTRVCAFSALLPTHLRDHFGLASLSKPFCVALLRSPSSNCGQGGQGSRAVWPPLYSLSRPETVPQSHSLEIQRGRAHLPSMPYRMGQLIVTPRYMSVSCMRHNGNQQPQSWPMPNSPWGRTCLNKSPETPRQRASRDPTAVVTRSRWCFSERQHARRPWRCEPRLHGGGLPSDGETCVCVCVNRRHGHTQYMRGPCRARARAPAR